MSNFLINLARRGAGLPTGQTNGRPSAREYQASSEHLEPDQIVETIEPEALETGEQPTFETTAARRIQTSQASLAQAPQLPQAVLTPAPTSLIQRSKEANSQTANPLSAARSQPSRPSAFDQNDATEASIAPSQPVRQFHSPINEQPSSSFATAQLLTESVVVATPRFSANEQSPMIDSQGPGEPSRTILSVADKALQIVPITEIHEYAPKGERQRERDQLGAVTLTPRSPAIENQQLTKLSNVVPAASADVTSMPIHVRIAKVEVRAAPATVPPSAPRVGPAPIGFGSYYRLRTYRS